MAKLDLPTGPAELLEAVRAPLGKHLGGEHHVRLGGGTALAARWAHRHSTDVDLFLEAAPYQRLFKNAEQFTADLERHTGAPNETAISPGFAHITLADGGQISLSTSPPLTDQPQSNDTVRGTRVPLETNAEILAKKFGYRMIQNVHLVPRDLYDIAVARRLGPGALQAALSTLTNEQLDDIKTELRYLPPDWAERHSHPLVAPTSRDDAVNVVGIVRGVLQQHIHSRISPRPHGFTWER